MAPRTRTVFPLRWRWLLPAAALVVAFHHSPFGVALDRAFYDWASRHPLRPPAPPADSALVLIDEPTMAQAGAMGMRWPFPRHAFAGLIAALHRAGAEKIAVDFVFLEESDRPEFDQLLASVAAVLPGVVLARTEERHPVFWDDAFVSAHPQFFQQARTGTVDFAPDADGVARHYLARGSLAAAVFDVTPPTEGGLLRWRGGVRALHESGRVPVLSAARFLVAGQGIVQRVTNAAPDMEPEAIARALRAEPPLRGDPAFDAVRGKTVFLGASAAGTFDVKPVPMGNLEPGTLLHWTAWSNLVAGGFIAPLPRVVSLGLAALFALGIITAATRWPGVKLPAVVAVGAAVIAFGGSYAGLSAGWFLPPSTPILAATLVLLGVSVESFWSERRRRGEIQAMFGSYVDPAVVSLLMRDPNAIRLGGERREASVFFSDLAGFTDLSEKIPAEQLVQIINLYLEEMSDCLIGYGAYIDKYIGDAVMAVFGAPQATTDHPLAACRAALATRGVLARINRQLANTHRHTLHMRTGINTGEMIVGNVGSERKRNYTVLGDAVNLASRLEAANKGFGTDILLGETTARAVEGQLITRPLTRLRVKGKFTAVEVHELIGMPAELTASQHRFLEAYRGGYANYTAREFAAAAQAFARAREHAPDDRMTAELLQSAQRLAQAPPHADWEPILTLETK